MNIAKVMTEILVSVENYSAANAVMNAIRMLKGVTGARLWRKDAATTDARRSSRREYSPRIEQLRRLHGNGISQEDVNHDERLSYLLSR